MNTLSLTQLLKYKPCRGSSFNHLIDFYGVDLNRLEETDYTNSIKISIRDILVRFGKIHKATTVHTEDIWWLLKRAQYTPFDNFLKESISVEEFEERSRRLNPDVIKSNKCKYILIMCATYAASVANTYLIKYCEGLK